MNAATIPSPIGTLLLCQRGEALCAVRRIDDERADIAQKREGVYNESRSMKAALSPAEDSCAWEVTPLLTETKRQINAYFAGQLRAFDLPLAPEGSAFDRAVWYALTGIAYGSVNSYGELAAAIGNPKASRAVGGACSRNPVLIIIPCHRAVGATGRLTGFAAGMAAKRALLTLEGFHVDRDRILRRT